MILNSVPVTAFPILLASALLPLAGQAAVIGLENFDYPDGSVVGRTGGTGWTHEAFNDGNAPPQTPSDWDLEGGNIPQVVSSTLITNNGGAIRQFGGITQGEFDSNEREGAIRGVGSVFFSTSITVAAMRPEGQNQWAGFSSHDFFPVNPNHEKIFFGVPGQSTETRYFGLSLGGPNPGTFTTIPVIAGQTYTLIGMVDFDNDLAAIWVNPDGGDTVSSYDASLFFASNNWLTGLRLASNTGVAWDNVKVGTTFSDVLPVPEPSMPLLGLAGTVLLARRSRFV